MKDDMPRPLQEGDTATKASVHDATVRHESARRTRRSFLWGALGAAGAYGIWHAVSAAPLSDELQRPLREAELFNAAVSRHLLGDRGRTPEYARSRAVRDVRVNGDIGLDTGLQLASWRLQVTGLAHPAGYPQSIRDVTAWKYQSDTDSDDEAPDNSSDGAGGIPQAPPAGSAKQEIGNAKDAKSGPINVGSTTVVVDEHATADLAGGAQPGVLLTLDEIRSLPRYEMTTEFKCIEGWSEIVHWGGARFSDLIARYRPMDGPSHGLARYVSLDTTQGDYYVGLDMEDALHPQTLLCYEINGQPLTMEHGAPLRLVIPIKYGIKHLKQIGKISFTNAKPRDYWAERGYDWYAGH